MLERTNNCIASCVINVFTREEIRSRTSGGQTSIGGIFISPDKIKGHGFNTGLMHAFSTHKAVEFTPDDLHLLILQGVSLYIQKFEQAFRGLLPYLPQSGKKELGLELPQMPVEGDLNPWKNVPEAFSTLLSHELSEEKGLQFIRDVTQGYSTSMPDDLLIKQVTLLGMFSPFFEYSAVTFCGIPSFILKGTEQDWQQIYDLPDKLVRFFGFEPEQLIKNDRNKNSDFSKNNSLHQMCIWLMRLKEDGLRYFNFSRKGQLNDSDGYQPTRFWQNFYKYFDANNLSGSYPGVNGTFLLFFPLLSAPNNSFRLNELILNDRKQYEKFLAGEYPHMPIEDLPKNVTSCTIKYNDFSTSKQSTYYINFQAGFFSFKGMNKTPLGITGFSEPVSFERTVEITSSRKPQQ